MFIEIKENIHLSYIAVNYKVNQILHYLMFLHTPRNFWCLGWTLQFYFLHVLQKKIKNKENMEYLQMISSWT